MPLYFFHLLDGIESLPDREGRCLANLGTAREVAVTEARAIIAADIMSGVIIRLDQHISIEDHAGRVLHTLNFADTVSFGSPR